jgi:hypothetical protein
MSLFTRTRNPSLFKFAIGFNIAMGIASANVSFVFNIIEKILSTSLLFSYGYSYS